MIRITRRQTIVGLATAATAATGYAAYRQHRHGATVDRIGRRGEIRAGLAVGARHAFYDSQGALTGLEVETGPGVWRRTQRAYVGGEAHRPLLVRFGFSDSERPGTVTTTEILSGRLP